MDMRMSASPQASPTLQLSGTSGVLMSLDRHTVLSVGWVEIPASGGLCVEAPALRIGQVAQASGLTVKTVRFYSD